MMEAFSGPELGWVVRRWWLTATVGSEAGEKQSRLREPPEQGFTGKGEIDIQFTKYIFIAYPSAGFWECKDNQKISRLHPHRGVKWIDERHDDG